MMAQFSHAQSFSNLSIRNKILTVNAITLLFLIALAAISTYSLNTSYEQSRIISEKRVPNILIIKEIQFNFVNARLKVYKSLSDRDMAKADRIWQKEYLPIRDELNSQLKTYESRISFVSTRKLFDQFQTMRSEYITTLNHIHELAMQNDLPLAASTLQKSIKEFNPLVDTLGGISKINQTTIVDAVAQSKATYNKVFCFSVGLALLSILLSTMLSFYLARKIGRPISDITELASAMASGDLSRQVDVLNSKDELGALSRALDHMVGNLRNLINDIKNNAASVASSSEELSATSTQMKQTASIMSSVSSNAFSITEELDGNIRTVAVAVGQSSASVQEIVNASTQVERKINAVDNAATKVSANLQTIASASEEMSAAVSTVAAAVDEMSASLNEVSKQAGKAARVAGQADETAGSTQIIMNTLGDSAKEIGNIVEVIGEINQINATIASAVEEQTATANEISQSVNGAAQASADVSKNVLQAAEIAGGVTKQVQEANVSVVAISRNLQEVSSEISDNAGKASSRASMMTKNIESVTESSTYTEQGATDVQTTSQELAKLASMLEKTVAQFAL